MRLIKRLSLIFAGLAAAFILTPTAAFASSMPAQTPTMMFPLSQTVVDTADVFSAEQEAQLDRQFRSIYSQSESRIAFLVDTVPSLDGSNINDYVAKRITELGIQPLLEGKGVFIVLAPNDEQVHFSVGAGLTSRVPTTVSDAIIKSQVTPNFPSQDYYTGISNGVTGITDAYKVNAPTPWYKASYFQAATPYIVGAGGVLIIVIIVLAVIRKHKEKALQASDASNNSISSETDFMPFSNIISYNSSKKQ